MEQRLSAPRTAASRRSAPQGGTRKLGAAHRLLERIGLALVATLACGGVLAQTAAPAPAATPAPASAPAPATAPAASAPEAAKAVCKDCGVVQNVRQVEEKGQGSGLGAVAGGVVGGVLGHQIGGGTGKTLATIAGAGGGAYAGHQVEKNVKKKVYWAVSLKMDNGQARTFTYSAEPAVKAGDRVKLVDGGKRLALLAN